VSNVENSFSDTKQVRFFRKEVFGKMTEQNLISKGKISIQGKRVSTERQRYFEWRCSYGLKSNDFHSGKERKYLYP
jgi:hypothetical protein